MLPRHHDPIIAVATAPGRGAVGIVRVSGRDLDAFVVEPIDQQPGQPSSGQLTVGPSVGTIRGDHENVIGIMTGNLVVIDDHDIETASASVCHMSMI